MKISVCNSLVGVSTPGFLKISMPASEEINRYGLKPEIIYAFTAKGWDMKNNGHEIYKIEGIGWVPAKHFKAVTGINPN